MKCWEDAKMPKILGIPLIGFIQMLAGAAIVIFVLVKYVTRPKKNRQDGTVIKNVHIIVGDGTELNGQNVYIRKGRIEKITSEAIDTKNVGTIDGSGKTLMPGLIDSHVHIQGINNRSDEDSERFLAETVPEIFSERILPYGITTLKDLCAPRHFIYKLRDKIKSGEITGPELLVVGPNFTAPNGHPASTLGGDNPWIRKELADEVSSPEEVSAAISKLKAAGVDFLKLTYQGGEYWYFDKRLEIAKLDKPLMEQVIREGKENGLKTTAHVFYKEDVRDLLNAGIYGIEHGVLDEALSPDDDLIKLWKESGAYFVPTVNAMTYEKDPDRLKNSMKNLKTVYDAGIPIAMGTDNMLETMSGDTEHRELQYYVEAGLTPMQAIVAATKSGAEYLGVSDRKGTVEEGREADLILLDKNPAEDISYLQFIDKVFLKGKIVYSAAAIQSYDIPDFRFANDISSAAYVSADGKEERVIQIGGFNENGTVTYQINREGKQRVSEEYELEPNLSARKWKYSRPEDSTELSAVRENGVIHLTGTFKGKPQDKRLKIGDGLWYQLMDLSMPAFVMSEQEKILFYSIGTGNNRGAMGLGEFSAKKLGEENVELNGKVHPCIKVSFVLTMFSWAWTGLYWYDKDTGMLVRSGEKKGNGVNIQYTVKG